MKIKTIKNLFLITRLGADNPDCCENGGSGQYCCVNGKFILILTENVPNLNIF